MGIGDVFESETFVAAGATATALSPRVRGWVRRGLVYTLAGAMTAADAAAGVSRGAARRVPVVGGAQTNGASGGSRTQTSPPARSGSTA